MPGHQIFDRTYLPLYVWENDEVWAGIQRKISPQYTWQNDEVWTSIRLKISP